MIKISFKGHRGSLNIDTNGVQFYEHDFLTICDAIRFLKDIEVPHTENQYSAWSFRGKKGLKNNLDDWVLYNGRWLEEDFAKKLIKTGQSF